MIKKPTPAAADLTAQQLFVDNLKSQITDAETGLKSLTLEHSKVKLGGHDIHAKGLPVEFVQKVLRDFPTPDTTKLAAEFERDKVAPLRQQLADLKASLQTERRTLDELRTSHQASNAGALLVQANDRLDDARRVLAEARAHHQNLEKRLSAGRMAALENQRLAVLHDAAVAQALADGREPPAKPEPQIVEDTALLQTAVSLSLSKVKALADAVNDAERECRNLTSIIAGKKLADFVEVLLSEAHAQGIALGGVRDRLIELAGPSLMAQMDGDELHRLRREVAAMQPELDRLRSDNRVLQDGVEQLTTRRYG